METGNIEKKQTKTFYWIAKVFIILFMLFSTFSNYINKELFVHLGFPEYFRIELIIAKTIGIITLLLPFATARIKEWVYTGFVIAMILGFIAHICSGDPVNRAAFAIPVFVLVFLSIKYVSNKDFSKNYESIKKIK